MSTPAYAELQAITNFSFLRGASHADEIVARAKALGIAALAVADHNTLSGIVRAHTAAKSAGLRLLVGARLDLDDAPSLIALPRDRAAYGRLCRLLSLGQMRAEKGGCRLSLADVAAHAEGHVMLALPPGDWRWRHEAGGTRGPFATALARLRSAQPRKNSPAITVPVATMPARSHFAGMRRPMRAPA